MKETTATPCRSVHAEMWHHRDEIPYLCSSCRLASGKSRHYLCFLILWSSPWIFFLSLTDLTNATVGVIVSHPKCQSPSNDSSGGFSWTPAVGMELDRKAVVKSDPAPSSGCGTATPSIMCDVDNMSTVPSRKNKTATFISDYVILRRFLLISCCFHLNNEGDADASTENPLWWMQNI